jgi:signal transduction histidine kinase
MAIAQPPQLVKDFFPKFKRAAIVLIIALQVIILLAIAIALHYFGFFNDNPLAYVSTLVAQSVLGVVASLILFQFIARPIKNLLAAITHIAGEPTSTTPPNPNETHFVKNGLKPVLQTIYQLASATPDPIADGEKNIGLAISAVHTVSAETKASVEAALDATICGFVIMNQDRSIAYANKATPLRIDSDGVQSLDLLFNEHDTIQKWWDECEATAVRAERTWTRISNKLPDEEDRRFFDVIASYNKGTASEVVLTLIDRTHAYSADEEELDFIAFAAHELRGPITVIRGYLDVVQDELKDVLQPEHKELFHRLVVSANRLSGYVNNILNTSRYDRRHLKMHLSQTNIKDVYDVVSDDMQLRAGSQARMLTVSIPDGLPDIAADTASLSEVFANLIDNAIKYSSEGGAINVTGVSKGDTVEIAIEDHGIGMPGNVVSNLFQKFYRSHRSRETVAGTGIGLYISKAIVESHGGTISVRSEEGHGSTFTVSLPTYQIVADKLKAGNNGNEVLINNEGGWIKNHTMYRG